MSGVSPSAIDLVAMKVTWLTLGTRSKSPRMKGMLKRPSVGRMSPASWGTASVPPDVQDDVGVDLGRDVVLHDEPVAHGAHREIEAQLLEQRLAVVERPHRRLVDARPQRQVLDLEGLQVAPGDEAHLAAEAEALLEAPLEIEVERQVVDLEHAGAAVGEPLAVQRQIEVAGLEREQVGELDAAGAHAGGTHVEIDQLRHVAPHVGRAVERADERLLVERDRDAGHRDVGPERRHTHDHAPCRRA